MSEFNPILYMDCVNAVRALSDEEFFGSRELHDTKNWFYAWRIEYKRRFN